MVFGFRVLGSKWASLNVVVGQIGQGVPLNGLGFRVEGSGFRVCDLGYPQSKPNTITVLMKLQVGRSGGLSLQKLKL